MCPKGSYALYDDSLPTYEVQRLTISGYKTGTADEFALTFRTTLNEEFTTKRIIASPYLSNLDVENALNELPNKVIEDVDVYITTGAGEPFTQGVAKTPVAEWHFNKCGDYSTPTTSITPTIGSYGVAGLVNNAVCDSNGFVLSPGDDATGTEHALLGTETISLWTAATGGKASVQLTGFFDVAATAQLLDIAGMVKIDVATGTVNAEFNGFTQASGSAASTHIESIVVGFEQIDASNCYLEIFTQEAGGSMATAAATSNPDTGTAGTLSWTAISTNYVGRYQSATYADKETKIETIRLWSGVRLTAADAAFLELAPKDIKVDITFAGAATTGDQFSLECRSKQCGAGCQPMLANAIEYKNSSDILATTTATCLVGQQIPAKSANLECSGRGRCDYTSGLCECFTGYTDEFCSTQSALI